VRLRETSAPSSFLKTFSGVLFPGPISSYHPLCGRRPCRCVGLPCAFCSCRAPPAPLNRKLWFVYLVLPWDFTGFILPGWRFPPALQYRLCYASAPRGGSRKEGPPSSVHTLRSNCWLSLPKSSIADIALSAPELPRFLFLPGTQGYASLFFCFCEMGADFPPPLSFKRSFPCELPVRPLSPIGLPSNVFSCPACESSSW